MAKNIEVESPVINIIGNGTIIKGDIKASGDLRIDGTLIGSVTSKGKVVVGTTGNVEGEINCQSADLSGNIKATIIVAELLAMKASANVSGEITTGKISIEPGAIFSGYCNRNTPVAKTVPEPKMVDEKIQQPS
jgi:cytoskeletal protein CcmA (bactofilin family)